MCDVPRHITPPPPRPPTKTKKDFMQVRPKLTKGRAKDLDLAPDILVVIVCSTDQPSGAGSLRCRWGKTKVIMNGRMISHILKKARVQQQARSARNALKVAPNSVSFSLLIRWQVGTKLDLLQVDLSWRAEGKPLYFKVLIDWATFLSHPCLDRPSWPIQLFRHENWSTPRCRHHQKVLFALFVYCF